MNFIIIYHDRGEKQQERKSEKEKSDMWPYLDVSIAGCISERKSLQSYAFLLKALLDEIWVGKVAHNMRVKDLSQYVINNLDSWETTVSSVVKSSNVGVARSFRSNVVVVVALLFAKTRDYPSLFVISSRDIHLA